MPLPWEEPVDQATLTERYTEEAIGFIRRSARNPFFLYLAYSFPHVPLHAGKEFAGRSRRGLYGDVVETIDWSVGRILGALEKEGVNRNTLLVFTSDNGPWLEKGTDGGSAGLLRDGKDTTSEGGMRVPFVARWPGKIPAGLVSAEVATSMDLYTSFLSAAGMPVPANRPVDGKDILPLLTGSGASPHGAFYYYKGPVLEAVREGRWKLRIPAEPGSWISYRDRVLEKSRAEKRTFAVAGLGWGSGSPELFDLEVDPSERFNLLPVHPDVAARLKQRMVDFSSRMVPGPAFELTSRGKPKSQP